MNIGGLALIFLVVAGGAFGLILVVSHANMDAPVDSSVATTSIADNETREAAVEAAPALTTLTGWIVIIIAAMMVFAAFIYMAKAYSGGGRRRSRY